MEMTEEVAENGNEKPRPHAIVRDHAGRQRRRIGLGNGPPQRFALDPPNLGRHRAYRLCR